MLLHLGLVVIGVVAMLVQIERYLEMLRLLFRVKGEIIFITRTSSTCHASHLGDHWMRSLV